MHILTALPAPELLIGMALALFVAYTIFGVTGFGSALIAAPVLAQAMPISTIVPLLAILDLTAAITNGFRIDAKANRGELMLLFPAMAIGSLIGAALLFYVPTRSLMLALGIFIIAYAVWGFLMPQSTSRIARGWAIPISTAGGIVSGLFGMGGAIYAMYISRRFDDRDTIRATQSALIGLATFHALSVFAADRLGRGADRPRRHPARQHLTRVTRQFLGRVDVDQRCLVRRRHFDKIAYMTLEQVARTDIAFDRLQLGEQRAMPQHRLAALAVTDRHDDRRRGVCFLRHAQFVDQPRRDERHIAEHDQRRIHVRGNTGDPPAQGRGKALRIIGIVYGKNIQPLQRVTHGGRIVSGHDDDAAGAGSERGLGAMSNDRLSVNLSKQLVLAPHARAAAGGKNHRGERPLHDLPGLRSVSVNCARIEIEISAGVAAPIARPIGPLMRASVSVSRPFCASRSRRLA
jgi:uncharacterized membrane protein YfcA